MTENQIKEWVNSVGADGVSDTIQYLVDQGIVTTKQKIAYDKNVSRGWIDLRMRNKYYREIHMYKYGSIIIDHERITGNTEQVASPEESAQ